MPYDPAGQIFDTWEETTTSYPKGLKLHIDAVEFETTGLCVEERITGTYSTRRWIGVAPIHTNGIRHQPRLVDERGVRGLKERANRERHTQEQEPN